MPVLKVLTVHHILPYLADFDMFCLFFRSAVILYILRKTYCQIFLLSWSRTDQEKMFKISQDWAIQDLLNKNFLHKKSCHSFLKINYSPLKTLLSVFFFLRVIMKLSVRGIGVCNIIHTFKFIISIFVLTKMWCSCYRQRCSHSSHVRSWWVWIQYCTIDCNGLYHDEEMSP